MLTVVRSVGPSIFLLPLISLSLCSLSQSHFKPEQRSSSLAVWDTTCEAHVALFGRKDRGFSSSANWCRRPLSWRADLSRFNRRQAYKIEDDFLSCSSIFQSSREYPNEREREAEEIVQQRQWGCVCVCVCVVPNSMMVWWWRRRMAYAVVLWHGKKPRSAETAPVFFFVVVVVVVDIQPACHHPSRLVTLKKKGGDLRVVVVKDTPTPLVSKVNSAPVRYSLFLCCVRVSEREEPF